MKLKFLRLVLLLIGCCIMTSLAMTPNQFIKMMSSSGAPVCSIEPPSQVLSMPHGGVIVCGSKCSVSDMCTYFQLNSLIASGQCQLYNTLPVNFTNIGNCAGFKFSPKCLDGWIPRARGCYKLVTGQFQSWNQAEAYCSAFNTPQESHLINIQSVDEQQLVAELVSKLIVSNPLTISSVNLALQQPTWQSSTFQTEQSGKAVDGNKDPNLSNGHCSHTDGDSSPWFAVDLGKLVYVYGAVLTNRDTNPQREDNFLVGLMNNPPSTMPPTNYSYTTCGQWPGSAPASATMFVKCTDNLPPARYVVIIQKYTPRGYLQICELEVYEKVSAAFVWLNGVRPGRTSSYLLSPYQQSPMLQTYNWGYTSPVATSSCQAIDPFNGAWYETQCVAPNGTSIYAICETS